MKRKEELNNNTYFEFLDHNLKDDCRCIFYLQTWQDGDSFIDICKNDGGLKTDQILLYSEKNKRYTIKTKTELLEKTRLLMENKSFASKNEVYKLGYDIYIIYKNNYFVLCPELNKGYYAKLNSFNRVFGFINYKEPWDEEKFGYWEKRKNNCHFENLDN